MSNKTGPKILVIDIELSPLMSYTWGLFDQNIGLNQVQKDWNIIAVAAKWLAEPKMYYWDLRGKKDTTDDRDILKEVWKLLDEADIVVGQNSKSFDTKKLNARFVLNGMKPPSSYKHLDTLCMARKHFGFTSNKLEYLTGQLCTKYKKSDHAKYPGMELWKQCMIGNQEAWKEMKIYNIYDVLSTEELYGKLAPWDNSIDFSIYRTDNKVVCKCGSQKFVKNGFDYQRASKVQRFKCVKCGSEAKSKINLLTKEKKESLKR